MKRVKLVYKNKIRKYEVPEENCQVHVSHLIQAACKGIGLNAVLQYLDEENDWITIGTPADLLLCLTSCETPKIYIFNASETVANRKKHKAEEEEDGQWVKFDPEESPSIVKAPPVAKEMEVDAEEVKRDPDEEGGFQLPVDWDTLVEDFLALKAPLQTLVGEVYDAVENGKDLQSAVVEALGKEPFKEHPFVVNAMPDIKRLLTKANHMGVLILQAGKNGLMMAMPILLRAVAKMKNGGGSQLVDMAPVFMQLFPNWGNWLGQGLGNGQERTFDLGAVFRTMMANNSQVPEQGEPAEQGEIADAADPPEVDAGIVIHKGITCDVCEIKPIIGVRYKCIVCPDFDMCEGCKEKGVHQKEHALLAMPVPAPRAGFMCGGGHNKGAAELFKPPWMCKQRRAMRKAFKKCFKENDEFPEGGEQQPHFMRGGPGPRGRGRWRGRRHWHPHGRPHPGPPPPGPAHFTPGLDFSLSSDSTDSSSDSSSSDSCEQQAVLPRNKAKMPKKRLKRKLKKLQKKRKKIKRKVQHITKRQRKIARKLTHFQNVDLKLGNEITHLQHKIQTTADNGQIQQNQPGHDPNPNVRAKRRGWGHPWNGMRKPHPYYRGHPPPAYESPWGAEPLAAPAMPNPHGWQLPSQGKGNPEPSFKYEKQLKLLKEMGFSDVDKCKEFLEDSKGNVKQVIMLFSNLKL